ncbi:hypothetical protein AVEN_138211-1 [Araneus ventricosus]|uniref:Uncharacterized protein n=1 Tax=Araneus ventricosus TaxID=182803 RepID=A0A4Y2I5G2_ARAVE|nr:hypothetical protein AVEN_138211-1 [Araneus ventricosus]
MTRTTPELAPPSPNFHATRTGGRLVTTYDLTCNRPHTRRIFSAIEFRIGTLQPQSRDQWRIQGLVGVNVGTLSMPIDEVAETPKMFGTSITVSPFDISCVPNIKKKTTTRGREAARSASSHWITIQGSVDDLLRKKCFRGDP